MNELAAGLAGLAVATCDSCRAKPATLAFRHDGNVLSVHCSEACATTAARRSKGRVPRMPHAKEMIIDRLYHVAPENAPDGGTYVLAAGTTLFHGISDVDYVFGDIRDFSYVSNNLNPSIGAGIGEKTAQYGTNKLHPRLFELETTRDATLVLVNEGEHGEKIEKVDELDRSYGYEHDGYISSRGEEELRLRGKMTDNYRMVRSYFFPAMPLKELPENRNETDLEGDSYGNNGERTYGRWAPVAGFAVETLPFADRVFSYALLRQVDAAIQSRPLARRYADALMIGAYNLVRRGKTARTYVAFQEAGVWNFPIFRVGELRCHDHPNVSRVVCAFLVTIRVGDKEFVLGGGPLNKLGEDIAFSTLCNLWMASTFNAVLKRNQGTVPRGFVELRVPYSIAQFFVGIVGQGVQDSWLVDGAVGDEEKTFYYKLHASIVNHLRAPSGISFESPEFATSTLLGAYELGQASQRAGARPGITTASSVFGALRARIDYHPVQMIRHAALVRSPELLAHTLKHIEELARRGSPEAGFVYVEHILTCLADMSFAEDTGEGVALSSDVDWLVRQVTGSRGDWFRTVTTIPYDTMGWKPVSRLARALVQVLNNYPSALRHGNLFGTFLLTSGNEMHVAVAGELCMGIKDWTAFQRSGELAWDVLTRVRALYASKHDGDENMCGSLAQHVDWVASILQKQRDAQVPWKERLGLEALLYRNAVHFGLVARLIESPYVNMEILEGVLRLAPAEWDRMKMVTLLELGADYPNQRIDEAKMGAALGYYRLWEFFRPSAGYHPVVDRLMDRIAPEEAILGWLADGEYSTPRAVQALYSRVPQPPPPERLATYEEAVKIVGGRTQLEALAPVVTRTPSMAGAGVTLTVYDRELLRIHLLIASTMQSARASKRKVSRDTESVASGTPPLTPVGFGAEEDTRAGKAMKAMKGAPDTPLLSPETK